MKTLLLTLATLLLWVLPAQAATIFSENFEVTAGDMVTTSSQPVLDLIAKGWTFGAVWGCPDYCAGSIVTAPAGRTGKVLRYEYRGQYANTNNHMIFARTFTGQDEVWERWFVRYDVIDGGQSSSWTGPTTSSSKQHYFNHGGADPISSVIEFTPADPVNIGVAIQRTFNVLCPNGNTGTTCNYPRNISGLTMPKGQWVCMETRQKMNTVGQANGIIEVYQDGTKTLNYTNVIWRDTSTSSSKFKKVALYRQGANNMYRYEDDYVLATIRIGCGVPPPPPDTTAPTPPTSLVASVNGGTQITLTWAASPSTDVTQYNIRRCVGASCTPATFQSVSGSTLTYVNTGLVAGTVYGYSVNAQDAAGNQSTYTATVYGTTTTTGRTVLATYDFNIADGTDLGTVFDDTYNTRGPCKIVSQRFLPTTLNTECFESYNGVSTPNDQWAQVRIPILTGAQNAFIGVNLRMANSPTRQWYSFHAVINGSNTSAITKYDTASIVDLVTDNTTVWAAGDKIRAEAEGTTLRLYRLPVVGGEVKILETTDASYASGKTGVNGFVATGGTLTNLQGDDFQMGGFGTVTGGTIAFDAISESSVVTTNAVSFTHTTGSGSNRSFEVCTFARGDTANVPVLTATYGGVALTKIRNDTRSLGATSLSTELWRLTGPVSGPQTVTITWTGALSGYGAATGISFAGVDQTSPLDANTGSNNVGTTLSSAITTVADNAWIVDCALGRGEPLTIGAGQTSRSNRNISGSTTDGAGVSTVNGKTPAGAETMDWTQAISNDWTHSTNSLKPAPTTPPAGPPTIATVDATSINATLTYGAVTPTTIRVATETVSEVHPIADFPSGVFTYTTPILNSLTTVITFCPRDSGGVENAAGCVTDSSITVIPVDHGPNTGVLRKLATNERWLTNDSGNAIYLAGTSGGTNESNGGSEGACIPSFCGLQDISFNSTMSVFDYATAFSAEATAGRDFLRFWNLEQSAWAFSGAELTGNTYGRIPLGQLPYRQTGTRVATPNGVNVTVGIYDLSQYNQAYFDRVRTRVLAALNLGIVPSVMLFSSGHLNFAFAGFSHPYLAANNVNGVDCDTGLDGNCQEVQTLMTGVNGANILAFQDNYVKKMIDTLNDIDGFIWEVTNESENGTTYGTRNSLNWVNHITDTIHTYEAQGGRQTHPVWMSPYPETSVANAVANTHADIATNFCITGLTIWDTNPTANAADKTIDVRFYDSDHTGGAGACGTEVSGWPWVQFTRGYYPIFLDERETAGVKTAIKTQLAQTITYANRVNLKGMVTATNTSIITTGFGLYETCKEYLAFRSDDGANNIDLSACSGSDNFAVEFFNPVTGVATAQAAVAGGALRSFNPSGTDMSVVYLKLQPPPVDSTPPMVFNLQPTGTLPIGTTSTVMSASTSENATCFYSSVAGRTYAQLQTLGIQFAGTGTQSHNTPISSLTGNTTYTYYGRCQDTAGNPTTSDTVWTWTVAGQTDFTAPTMFNAQPTTEQPAGTTQATLSFETNEAATCHWDTTDIAYASMANVCTTNGLTHSFTVTGLTNGSTTTRYARASDYAEPLPNITTSSIVLTVTVASSTADVTAPTTVTNLVATPLSSSQISLVWPAATDVGGVAGYNLYSCVGVGCSSYTFLRFVGTTSDLIEGLASSTSYSFVVRAIDTSNNLSVADSNVASATTFGPIDTTPPSTPTNLHLIQSFTQSVLLGWDAGTDDSGSVTTIVEQCQGVGCTNFGVIRSQISLQQLLANLTPGTLNRFRIIHSDAAGNVSAAYSTILDVTLPLTGLPVPRVGFSFGQERLSTGVRLLAGTRLPRP